MEKFQIQRVIGEGAYGRAVLCKEIATDSYVVIKEIALGNLSPQEQRDARKETKILSSLHHPNIIGYKGSFMMKNTLHIVMDYADNGDLFEQIQKAKGVHFKEEQILDWFVQICLALKHIHDRKILHRDIKCQNIFLMKSGMIKMGDFGIAKVLDHTSQFSKTAIGTPYYLSPEICQGKSYNAKSDIWSLGCVLYEICTLNHAFDSNCMNGLIMKILRAKHSPIPYYYSPNLRNLVDMLLNKNAAKRPSINQILNLEFVRARIDHLLGATMQKIEFSHTVFHGCKGLETPSNISPNELAPIMEEPENKAKPDNAIKKLEPQPKPDNIRVAKKPIDNPIPKPNVRIVEKLAIRKKPNPQPHVAPQEKIVKPPTPKINPKDDILVQKNAAVLAERQVQLELKKQREEEKKRKEEQEAQKRQELLEKQKEKEQERKNRMKQLQQEEAQRKKKFDQLEAPFKAQQKVVPVPVSAPKKPAERKVPSIIEKKRKTPSPVEQPDTESDSSNVSEPELKPKSQERTSKPGKVQTRENEVISLREMIKKRREDLKKQRQNGDQNVIQIGNEIVEVPDVLPEEPKHDNPVTEIVVEQEKKSEEPASIVVEFSDSYSDFDEQDDLISLAAIAKNIFDHPPSDNEAEEEQSSETQLGTFIFEGKELKLDSVNNDDSLNYRVEALRIFLEDGLGMDTFIKIYGFLTSDQEISPQETDDRIREILKSQEQIVYYPLVQQLIVCEESLSQ